MVVDFTRAFHQGCRGKGISIPIPIPSHSHRVSVGIPTGFPMGIPMGNSHVGILCGFHMANPPSKSYENSKSYWILYMIYF